MGVWSRTYVCCAVPLYNSGIYCILAQFLIISIVTGVLAFASPSIITVTTPNFVSYILGVLSIVVAGWQCFGFFGVYRDRVALFKTYSRINTILVLLSLLLSLAIIIYSAVRHSSAIDACQRLFSTDSDDETGQGICNIWTWVQVGIMGLLFVIVGLCELYFLMYSSIYASEQKLDHARYNSVYSAAAEDIRQSGYWDGGVRGPSYSQDDLPPPPGGPGQVPYSGQHGRGLSKSSGLRNEVGRREEEERYEYQQGGGYSGKVEESREYLGGGMSDFHPDYYNNQGGGGQYVEKQSTVVSGYRENVNDGYEDYPAGGIQYEQGFRPPGQESRDYEDDEEAIRHHQGAGRGYRY